MYSTEKATIGIATSVLRANPTAPRDQIIELISEFGGLFSHDGDPSDTAPAPVDDADTGSGPDIPI
jgi:hypothetical protein